MGYYSDFKLTAQGFDNEEHAEFFEFKLVKLSSYTGWSLRHTIGTEGWMVYGLLGEAKWYNAEEHLLQLSKAFPRVTIDLKVEGEERGDIWKLRARDGKHERVSAKVVFEDFKDLT